MAKRPSLLQDPDAITPQLSGFRGEPIIWPRYRPTKRQKLKNVGEGLLTSVLIAVLWALIDGVKVFTFLPFVTLGLDAVYAIVRFLSVRGIGLPKLPILYLPFTTIWTVAIGAPAFIYEQTAVWGWGAYLAIAAVTSVALLAYRLVTASTQYQLADERVSEDTAADFGAAFKDRSKFFSSKKGYLLDPPNRHQLPRIDLARFDGQVNELLNHTYFPPFYLPILGCLFYGGLALSLHFETDAPETSVQFTYALTRWFWPGLATIVCLKLLVCATRRWHREQIGLLAWAMQLFANSPRAVDTDKKSSWTLVGPYGHTFDRHMYLLFSYGLIYALLVQLLVVAPVFIPDSMEPALEGYPLVGTNIVGNYLNEGTFAWPLDAQSTLRFVAASLCLPPLVFFGLLFEFCGARIQCAHRLFTSESALTHDSYLFDFGDNKTNRNGRRRTKKKPLQKA